MKNIKLICFLLFMNCLIGLNAQIMIQLGGGGRSSLGPIVTAGTAQQERIVTLGGRLEPMRKITHSIPVAGNVSSILVSVGQRVQAGQNLVQLSRSVVGESYRPVYLEARLSGVVSQILVSEMAEVTAGTQAVIIIDDSSYLLKASLSDRDATAVINMANQTFTGTSTEGVSMNGRVVSISPEPDYSTGLFTLTMEFPRTEGSFLGMVIFVDLKVSSGGGVPVEKTAVFTENGESFIWAISQNNTLLKQQVKQGRELETQILIEEGIPAGARYIRAPRGDEKEGTEIREYLQASLGNNNRTGGTN